MKEIIASPNRVLHLGYEGEDNVTLIKFPYDDTWLDCGDGEFKVRVLRHGDTEAYNATEVIDNRESMTLTMTVTDIELSVRGRGELQLVYVCSGAIKKSEIYQYNVHRAIDSEVVSPPDGSIIASVEESLAEIDDEIGSLAELTTTDKSSLVSAINEVNAKEGGSITVDDALSGTSENPVQNKVVKSKFDSVDQTVIDVQTALAGKASTDVATQSADGLMSSADKTKLDGLGNSGVSDVQVNGTSVVSDGVANITRASSSNLGVVKIESSQGVSIGASGQLFVMGSMESQYKAGANGYRPVMPSMQHHSAFYGLAKVAGHDEKNSTLPVGQYTEEAKSAISDMLNGAVQVIGTTPTITALSGVRYVCGEVSTLDITPCVSGICDIVFTSGSTATVLTLPNTVKFPDGAFTPEANTTYELNIMDGIYGAVMAWT